MEKHIGSCSCGEIEFCFENDPINALFCYYKECQALTGSDKWFGLWVSKENFKFTKGTPSSYTRIGDSGKAINYQFCGTALFTDELNAKMEEIEKCMVGN